MEVFLILGLILIGLCYQTPKERQEEAFWKEVERLKL
jgi:hypothetical protein